MSPEQRIAQLESELALERAERRQLAETLRRMVEAQLEAQESTRRVKSARSERNARAYQESKTRRASAASEPPAAESAVDSAPIQSTETPTESPAETLPPSLMVPPLSPDPIPPFLYPSPRPSFPTGRAGEGGEQKPLLVIAPTRPAQRTARPASRTTPEEQAARQAVEQAYLEARGEPYAWGAADWKALRDCLTRAEGDLGTLLERWGVALGLGAAWPGCSTLLQLASKWGDVLAHIQAPRAAKPQDTRAARRAAGGDDPNLPGFGGRS